jgi:hypothetical protein
LNFGLSAATNEQSNSTWLAAAKDQAGHTPREIAVKLQSKLIAACVGAFVLLASQAVQATPGYTTAGAINASNAAVQSAVRAMRDDIARKKVAEREAKSETKTR